MKFSIREDDLSVQYSLASDPHFWVRVVKPVAGQTLMISDVLPGSQSPEGMGKALAAVLNKHVDSDVNAITFANIAPSLSAGKPAQRQVADRFDHLSSVVRSWAFAAGREVANGHLDLDRDSFTAVFRLT